ncbi:MAG: hypothetical protein ACLQVI_24100 [Polyangiaceae bacterium]
MHALSIVTTVVTVGGLVLALGCGGRSELLEDESLVAAPAGPVVSEPDATTAEVLDSSSPVVLDAGPATDASLPTIDSGVPFDATAADAPEEAAADSGSASDGALPSTAACLTGGNVLWVDGDPDVWPWWFAGTQTVAAGSTWAVQAENYYATYDGAILEVYLPGASPGDPFWYFEFNTWGTGAAMEAGATYSNVSTPPPGARVIPSGDFSIGYAATCAILSGTFQVEEFTASPGTQEQGIDTLLTFTAAFSAVCEQTELGVLRGCIHYDATSVADE